MGALAFLEALDVYECGLSYFKSTWNFVDLTLYLSWYGFYILKFSQGLKHDIIEVMTDYYTNDIVLMNILKVFVIFVSFLKIMSFCRVFEGFASLIMLLGTVIGDLFYFQTFFVILIMLFTLLQQVLSMEYNGQGYTDVSVGVALLL